jgi:hypothetical protein
MIAVRLSVRVLSELEGVVATVNGALDVAEYGVPKFRSSRLILTSLRVAPRRKINDLDS